MTSRETEIIEALRERRIRAMRAMPFPGLRGIALSISVVDLERFLDIIVKRPLSDEDGLALRVIGRGQDLGPDDDAWRFELVPGIVDAGFEFHAIANIPAADVMEVLARLTEGADSS